MVIANKDVKVGSEIPSLKKVAYQRALQERVFDADSIHHPEFAKKQGFAGPLVSGLVLSGYMTEMLVNFFGLDWLRGGKISETFIPPGVQEGNELTCHGTVVEKIEEKGDVRLNLDIWIEKGQGVKVLVGKASGVIRA